MHPQFKIFEEATCELQKINLLEMSVSLRTAFCINAYNLIVIHAFVRHGPPRSLLSRMYFFNKIMYNLGGEELSLNEIEGGILRGNKPQPYALSKPFGKHDPRAALALPFCEKRIHFALNCGAKSCPPVKEFTSSGLQEELNFAAMAFCESDDNVRVDMKNKTLWVSKIFDWYSSDFGSSRHHVASCIRKWLHGDKQVQLDSLLIEGRFRVRSLAYNWADDGAEHIATFGTVFKESLKENFRNCHLL